VFATVEIERMSGDLGWFDKANSHRRKADSGDEQKNWKAMKT
jgi:hypothetical protein